MKATNGRPWRRKTLWALLALLAGGCVGSTESLLKVPFLSLTVKAVDESDVPLAGARVETSNGHEATTDAQGLAPLSLGTVGVTTLTVTAEGRAPSVFQVTMPMDRGKTLTARLGKPVQIAMPVAFRAGGDGGLLGGLGALMGGQLYPLLFQSLFATQGYSMELSPYEPGQWTEWQVHTGDDDKPMLMRKAFLTRLENGQEWWRIELPNKKGDESMTMEVLFAQGRESLRRMRQKTGAEEAREVPVAEGWYSRPTQLTPESMEGSVKARAVAVAVPAGSYKADLMEFSNLGGGALRMWRATQVPGGVVKTEVTEPGGRVGWRTELSAVGTGAKTELGSY